MNVLILDALDHVQPGSVVKVVRLSDPDGDKARLGEIGRVECLDYDAGVGESYSTDPYIIVCFEDGGRDGFWREELGEPEDTVEHRPRLELLVVGARVE